MSGWIPPSSISETSDVNEHATKVAGTAVAFTSNVIGVAALGWNANVMPIRISKPSDGLPYVSDATNGLSWTADNGVDVVNISYGAADTAESCWPCGGKVAG